MGEHVKKVPAGAWDTHLHIFEPDKYQFSSERHFTPSAATLDQLIAFESSIGVDHVCIAHGLSFGPDCTSLLDYLKYFNGTARGICVLDIDTVTDETLDAYHNAGVRSVRTDFFRAKAMDNVNIQIDLIQRTAQRLAAWGRHTWSVQIQQPHLSYWHKLCAVAKSLPCPLVVDHLALIQGPSMAVSGTDSTKFSYTDQDSLDQLLEALRHGNTWIKISGPYRCSDLFHTLDDLEELVKLIVAANRERMVWGSDWPHTQRHKDRVGRTSDQLESFLKIEDETWIRSLSRWMTEEEWRMMWVDNPSKLYY